MEYTCRMCHRRSIQLVIDFGNHPVAHHLLDNPLEEARVYPVKLYYCSSCGLAQLIDSVSPEIMYENYICFSSWKNQPHIPKIIDFIGNLPGIGKNIKIFEVGCNDGIFLRALRERGYNNILGLEPARDVEAAARAEGFKTIRSFFDLTSARDIARKYGKFNLFVMRQVLEHIHNLEDFKKAMQEILAPGAFVIIEVPNFNCFLDSSDYTIWEEHVSYFTIDTLKWYLADSGINFLHSESVVFSSESLIVAGRYEGNRPLSIEDEYLITLSGKIKNYRQHWPIFKKNLNSFLEECGSKKEKVAIYGAGARLCNLVNFSAIAKHISFVVDDQIEKQNKYLPGSKLQILPSSALEKVGIDVCLLAVNQENENAVVNRHSKYIDRGGRFFSVFPPSEKLLPIWNTLYHAHQTSK